MSARDFGGIYGKLRNLANRVPRIAWWIAAGLASAIVLAVLVALVLTARPAFLGGYHDYARNYEALQSSLHSGLACNECHVDTRGPLVYEVALVGDFYRGLYKKPDAPAFVKLETPSSAACVRCHLTDWSDDASMTARIPHPAHLRVASETRDCVECHKWTAHEEEYVERHKEMPFSTVCASFGCHVGTKTAEECGDCHHSLSEGEGEWAVVHKETVREAGPNGCLEICHDADQCRQCHTTGERPDFEETVVSASVKAIEREHVKDDWIERHGSLALDDDSDCFECHVSVGECEDCHAQRPAFHDPKETWLTRHKDLAEGDDERRCLACHEKSWCEDCHAQFEETQ